MTAPMSSPKQKTMTMMIKKGHPLSGRANEVRGRADSSIHTCIPFSTPFAWTSLANKIRAFKAVFVTSTLPSLISCVTAFSFLSLKTFPLFSKNFPSSLKTFSSSPKTFPSSPKNMPIVFFKRLNLSLAKTLVPMSAGISLPAI